MMKITKSKLTRELLESYVGKKIKVTLKSVYRGEPDEVYEGILKLGNGFFYVPKKYVVEHMCFRLSHIKSIEVEE